MIRAHFRPWGACCSFLRAGRFQVVRSRVRAGCGRVQGPVIWAGCCFVVFWCVWLGVRRSWPGGAAGRGAGGLAGGGEQPEVVG